MKTRQESKVLIREERRRLNYSIERRESKSQSSKTPSVISPRPKPLINLPPGASTSSLLSYCPHEVTRIRRIFNTNIQSVTCLDANLSFHILQRNREKFFCSLTQVYTLPLLSGPTLQTVIQSLYENIQIQMYLTNGFFSVK